MSAFVVASTSPALIILQPVSKSMAPQSCHQRIFSLIRALSSRTASAPVKTIWQRVWPSSCVRILMCDFCHVCFYGSRFPLMGAFRICFCEICEPYLECVQTFWFPRRFRKVNWESEVDICSGSPACILLDFPTSCSVVKR